MINFSDAPDVLKAMLFLGVVYIVYARLIPQSRQQPPSPSGNIRKLTLAERDRVRYGTGEPNSYADNQYADY